MGIVCLGNVHVCQLYNNFVCMFLWVPVMTHEYMCVMFRFIHTVWLCECISCMSDVLPVLAQSVWSAWRRHWCVAPTRTSRSVHRCVAVVPELLCTATRNPLAQSDTVKTNIETFIQSNLQCIEGIGISAYVFHRNRNPDLGLTLFWHCASLDVCIWK